MNSEGHRKNILNPNYNYIGVGYVSQGDYWTQEFIGNKVVVKAAGIAGSCFAIV
jgi:hypothetical protein